MSDIKKPEEKVEEKKPVTKKHAVKRTAKPKTEQKEIHAVPKGVKYEPKHGVNPMEPKTEQPKSVLNTAPVAEAKPEEKKPRRKSAQPKSGKVFVVRGKRKESVARATIQKGKGVLRFNKMNVDALNNKYVRDMIKEPLRFLGPEANTIDISVTVNGGGMMGQAQAARTAIANALVQYFDDKALEQRMMDFDRFMIVEDSRRVEAKKYKGPKARARFQKSYR